MDDKAMLLTSEQVERELSAWLRYHRVEPMQSSLAGIKDYETLARSFVTGLFNNARAREEADEFHKAIRDIPGPSLIQHDLHRGER